MKVYMKSKTWMALIAIVALISTINVYFLSRRNGDVTSRNEASSNPDIHNLGHHHHLHHQHVVRLTKSPAADSDRLAVRNPVSPSTKNTDSPKQHLVDAPKRLRSERTCQNLTISLPVEDSQSFQPIAGTNTFVYSAYSVWSRVRIIVLRKRTDPRRFYCHLWSTKGRRKDKGYLYVTKGYVFTIPEDHSQDYLASYILCDIPPQLVDHPPFAVSVVYKEKCASPSNWLNVVLPQAQQFNFTVCVTPLNRNFSNTHLFVEMIEFNKLLGAERFVFYNYSIHPDIGKILHYYSDLGVVDLRQWPTTLPKQAHYFGQLAALNDCLYRYKNQSRYIVIQDLDEFIIPKGIHDNWSQLIKSREKINPKFSVFQARCTFFRKEWPKPLDNFPRNDEVKKYQSIVLGHTLREDKVLTPGHRSKYIFIPAMVETVGIHDTWATSGRLDRMETNIALLYHYRDWGVINDTQPRVEDTFVVKKFGVPLLDRLAEAWSSIQAHTGLT